jgi:pimeloyl-ACP methyl ester carboxylesterase
MSASLGWLWRRGAGPSLAFGRLLGFLLPVAVLCLAVAEDAAGQDAAKRRATDELPPPVDIAGNDLVTADGVALKATFFPGSNGKESVPVILLHSWKGSRKDYVTLAMALWHAGHAVLVPDLRGHGQSTVQYVGGNTVDLSAARFGPADFALMSQFDVETLKSLLVKKNNAGELNIEKLCVVGAEMGATVALNWALVDWSWPQYPGIKQGQHVKALVLLSPERKFKGLSVEDALKNPLLNRFLSVYIMVGNEDAKLLSQVERIYATLLRFHPEPPVGQEETGKTLFFKGFDTKNQGTRLFEIRGLGVEQRIERFIELRLVSKDYPWAETGKKPGKSAGK